MIGDGSWIREWRHRNNYSQDALALELEVKRQTVIKWEKSDGLDRVTYLALQAIESDPALKKVGSALNVGLIRRRRD